MNSQRPEEFSQSPGTRQSDPAANPGSSGYATRPAATVLVRGETLPDQEPKAAPTNSSPNGKEPARKQVSEAKVKIQNRLPVLDDDADLGVSKEQTVIRDGKADLTFTGKLLASAAPPSSPKGQWREYRIYETDGGKHVFSKVNRSIFVEERDTHEAEVFDPSPTSVPSQLIRGARELARARPLTWVDAAVAFFGYDPLAKALYRKLGGGQFEEHIS